MKHLDYLELLTNPLAGGSGGGGGSPAVLIEKSIVANGNYSASSDSADGYSAVAVSVQGGADANTDHPYIPTGYTEIKLSCGPKSTVISGYKAGQTNKQPSAYIPLWTTLNNGDKVALTGITSDTGEKYCVAGIVSGKTSYGSYQYVKLTIDYDGMLGNAAVVPSGYTEIKACCQLSKSTVKSSSYVAGTTNRSIQVPHDVNVAVGDKVALTGLAQDTGDYLVICGTVTSINKTTTNQYTILTIDYDGMCGISAPGTYIKNNGNVDVKGRESAFVDVHGTGTIQITENGTATVDGYKYANVQVPIPVSGAATRLDGMTSISNLQGDYSKHNQGIVAVQLPDVTSLYESFNYMDNLAEVYIGKNINSLSRVFEDNVPNLTAVAFDQLLVNLPSWSFYGYPSQNIMFYVPDRMLSDFRQRFSNIASQILSRVGMPWSATFAPFANGEIVTHNNQQWVSTADNNNGEPGVGADWSPYSP